MVFHSYVSLTAHLNLFLLTILFIRPSGQAEHIISEYSFKNSLLCVQVFLFFLK